MLYYDRKINIPGWRSGVADEREEVKGSRNTKQECWVVVVVVVVVGAGQLEPF